MMCGNCGQQAKHGNQFCQKCGSSLVPLNFRGSFFQKLFEKHKKAFLIIGAVILFFAILIIVVVDYTNSPTPQGVYLPPQATVTDNNSTFPATTTVDQIKIISSVVNIWCPDGKGGADGGSGTLWTPKGLILTNSHIIPQDEDENPIPGHCLVILPNAQGGIKDEYEGEPIIVPTLSKEYDLAFIKIDGPYTDNYGVDRGPYPTTFPDYPDFGCKDNNVTLAEPVTVFGYPEISDNGNALTITTGIVSSLPGDGTIVTSAKVAHGDSGGLAVDEYGCMIGIPSAVSVDDSESLGIIKSNNTIANFFGDFQDVVNSSNDNFSTNNH